MWLWPREIQGTEVVQTNHSPLPCANPELAGVQNHRRNSIEIAAINFKIFPTYITVEKSFVMLSH
jgi:hypothetical protein